MTTRTILLTLHIASVAGWLGADFVHYVVGHRFDRQATPVALAWARQEQWMHEKYYGVVAVAVLATGILLVLDGDWSWSGWFIWVGIGAVVGGATFGGIGLRKLSESRVTSLEAGDTAAAAATRRTMLPIQLLVTLLPILALLAMIDRWHA